MKKFATSVLVASTCILVAGLTAWAVCPNETREFNHLREKALCVVELPAGTHSVRASFTTSQPLGQLEVGLRPGRKREFFTLSVSGKHGLMCSATAEATRYAWSGEFPPGTYEVTASQPPGNHGALVVVAAEKPAYLTGWQILSRAYVGVLTLSAVGMVIARRAKNPRVRAASLHLFQILMLGFVVVFLYLLFHEGGHALGELIFGRYDFSRSDFWGIHGTPHSAGKPGPPLDAWQHAFISGAGPFLPTLAGWALFLLWSSRFGRNLRNVRPAFNLYFSAVVAMLVFPFVAVAGCLVGILSDGDWQGFIRNVPGPLWLIRGLLWGILLGNAVILWRVVPELWRTWKEQTTDRLGWQPAPPPTCEPHAPAKKN
jgi:hypothetical protein